MILFQANGGSWLKLRVQVKNRKEKTSLAYVARFNGDVPGAADACWVVGVGPVWRLDRTLRFGQPSTTELVLCRNRKTGAMPHYAIRHASSPQKKEL